MLIVVEISDRLPRLLRYDASFKAIVVYFVLRLPYLFLLTSPVVVLLAGLFLMNHLSKYSESVAMRGAGISIVRMVRPLLIFGFFFSLVILVMGEYVLPEAESFRRKVYKEWIKKGKVEDKKVRSNIHYSGKDNNLYYIGFFDGYRNTLKTIDITTFDHENGAVKKKIISAEAIWEEDQWHFKECYIRSFAEGELVSSDYYKSTVIEEVDVSPLDFIKSAKDPLSMNFFELKDYINRLKKIGEDYNEQLVELYLKISFPFANLIIILFSIPLVSTSGRSRARGLVFGIGLLICFLYLSAIRISQSLGYNGVLSPVVAAWAANVIFLTIGIYFMIKAEV
jgi:lipopolysaccharide export system permease protein